MSATPCYRHPAATATRSCSECFQPICAGCSVIVDGRGLCPDCAQAQRQRGTRRVLGGLALGAVVLVLGGAGLVWLSRAPVVAPAERARDAKTAALRAQLDQEPCDRTRAVPYAQALFSAEDWRGTLQFSDDFVARCGKFPALRSLSYAAHMRLSEFEAAVRDATELVDSAPSNASYRVWRAQAHDSARAPEQALVDFQEAFRLQPTQFQVAQQLAGAYEQRGAPCEAHRVFLEHQRASPPGSLRPEVAERLSDLKVKGGCGQEKAGGLQPAGRPARR